MAETDTWKRDEAAGGIVDNRLMQRGGCVIRLLTKADSASH